MILHLMMSNGYAFHSVVPESVGTPEKAAMNTRDAIERGRCVEVEPRSDGTPRYVNAGQIASFHVEV